MDGVTITGCAKANLDTLNGSCDKDWDFLIISITAFYVLSSFGVIFNTIVL